MSTNKVIQVILAVFLTVTAISCKQKPLFVEVSKMKNSTWDRFVLKNFSFPIQEEGKTYNISLELKTNADFAYDELPIYVILTSPSGEERMRDIIVKVKENNQFIGQKKDNFWISSSTLWKEIILSEKGQCKISIENMLPRVETAGIEEISIVVKAAQ